jgi:hypothetical protein
MSDEVKTEEVTEETTEEYKSEYLRTSKIKNLFFEDGQKLRISKEAKEDLYKRLEKAVQDEVKKIIDALPRITKGDNKGKLKQITIQKHHLISS